MQRNILRSRNNNNFVLHVFQVNRRASNPRDQLDHVTLCKSQLNRQGRGNTRDQ